MNNDFDPHADGTIINCEDFTDARKLKLLCKILCVDYAIIDDEEDEIPPQFIIHSKINPELLTLLNIKGDII
jgi:hypothetical protein